MKARSSQATPSRRSGRRWPIQNEVTPFLTASLSRITRSKSRLLSQNQEIEPVRVEKSVLGSDVKVSGARRRKWDPSLPLRRSPRLSALKSSAGGGGCEIGGGKIESCGAESLNGCKSLDLCASSAGNLGTIGVRTRSMDRSSSVPTETLSTLIKGDSVTAIAGAKIIAGGKSMKKVVRSRLSKSYKPSGGEKPRNLKALKRQNHCDRLKKTGKSGESMIGVKKRMDGLDEGKNQMSKIASQHCDVTATSCCWTGEQEAALRTAYLAAKPTPNFWKKVAKMVPGKTSQECFDRIHARMLTPQHAHRRYAKYGRHKSPISHLSLSCSKLLAPTNRNPKKTHRYGQKARNATKIVRHLLSKHGIASQGYGSDLFPILEDNADKSSATYLPANLFSTPRTMASSFSPLLKCQLSSSHGKDLTSPPILKRVENMALHEKFIDQLHGRDERRRKISNKGRSSYPTIQESEENGSPKAVLKAAKAALVSDATDFISRYKKNQEICMFDDEDVQAEGSDDELEEDI